MNRTMCTGIARRKIRTPQTNRDRMIEVKDHLEDLSPMVNQSANEIWQHRLIWWLVKGVMLLIDIKLREMDGDI